MKTIPNLTSIKDIPQLENMGVNIEFDPQEEEINPYDQLEDKDAKYVCEQYDNGNMAAWFCAHVTVSYKKLTGDDYLGTCSYKSFKEFTTTDKDYYMDMINVCVNEINRQVETINWAIQKHWDIRRAKNLIKKYDLHIVSSNVLETL